MRLRIRCIKTLKKKWLMFKRARVIVIQAHFKSQQTVLVYSRGIGKKSHLGNLGHLTFSRR